jgi:hypothetical protein
VQKSVMDGCVANLIIRSPRRHFIRPNICCIRKGGQSVELAREAI